MMKFIPVAFLTTFDCSKAESALADSNIRCHPVNEELLTVTETTWTRSGSSNWSAKTTDCRRVIEWLILVICFKELPDALPSA